MSPEIALLLFGVLIGFIIGGALAGIVFGLVQMLGGTWRDIDKKDNGEL
jgi:hypothetical protein